MTVIRDRPAPGEAAPESQLLIATRSAQLIALVTAAVGNELTTVASIGSAEELEDLERAPDMVMLDASLPELLSARLIGRLRHRWPVVLLVALDVPDEEAATALLHAGVDDAIETGRGEPHLLARLNAAARRTRAANALLRRRLGDVVYDRETRRVWCAGEEVEFAPRELEVLDALWSRAGELVRHESLHDFVWAGMNDNDSSNRIEVYISYVRRKLHRSSQVTIQNLRGVGYRLVHRNAADTPWTRDRED